MLFPYFSRFPHHLACITANTEIELMKRCTNLRSVEVQWVDSELCDHHEPKTVQRLRKEYRLDGMLEPNMPETLILNGSGDYATGHSVLKELKKWFEAEFREKGRKTKVIMR